MYFQTYSYFWKFCRPDKSSRSLQLPNFLPVDGRLPVGPSHLVLPVNGLDKSNKKSATENASRPKVNTNVPVKKSDQKFVCPLCKKSFEYEALLKKHMEVICSKVKI